MVAHKLCKPLSCSLGCNTCLFSFVLQDEAASRDAGDSKTQYAKDMKDSKQAGTQCPYKGCKLIYCSGLNRSRCQMSHLPSARTATAKVRSTWGTGGGGRVQR